MDRRSDLLIAGMIIAFGLITMVYLLRPAQPDPWPLLHQHPPLDVLANAQSIGRGQYSAPMEWQPELGKANPDLGTVAGCRTAGRIPYQPWLPAGDETLLACLDIHSVHAGEAGTTYTLR